MANRRHAGRIGIQRRVFPERLRVLACKEEVAKTVPSNQLLRRCDNRGCVCCWGWRNHRGPSYRRGCRWNRGNCLFMLTRT
jgi:hypothetical protein